MRMFPHRFLRSPFAIQPAHLKFSPSPTIIRPCLLHLPFPPWNRRTQLKPPPQPQTASSPHPIHHHHPRTTRRFSQTPFMYPEVPEKRGWVIYRTTYAPWTDSAWSRFRARVERESSSASSRGGSYLTALPLSESDIPSDPEMAADRPPLEWTWVEDRSRLDGVSRERLRREVFRGWVDGELERARARGVVVGPQAADNEKTVVGFDPAAVPRYAFFVQVDEEALRSLGGNGEGDQWDVPGAHVKFVDASWEPMREEAYWDGVPEEDRTEAYDEIDGCRQENVGWMRISPYMLGAEFYDAWAGVVDIWYAFYRRPPETLDW